jgi:hypothetical protein
VEYKKCCECADEMGHAQKGHGQNPTPDKPKAIANERTMDTDGKEKRSAGHMLATVILGETQLTSQLTYRKL